MRVGRTADEGFVAGVGKEEYEKVLKELRGYNKWQSTKDSFCLDLFSKKGLRLRQVGSEHVLISKEKVLQMDLPVLHKIVRITASVEKPSTKNFSEVSMARAKKISSFVTTSGFRYEICEVAQAPTASEALNCLEKELNLNYEIEVELEDPQLLQRTDEQLLASLLLKSTDLVAMLPIGDKCSF